MLEYLFTTLLLRRLNMEMVLMSLAKLFGCALVFSFDSPLLDGASTKCILHWLSWNLELAYPFPFLYFPSFLLTYSFLSLSLPSPLLFIFIFYFSPFITSPFLPFHVFPIPSFSLPCLSLFLLPFLPSAVSVSLLCPSCLLLLSMEEVWVRMAMRHIFLSSWQCLSFLVVHCNRQVNNVMRKSARVSGSEFWKKVICCAVWSACRQ